MPEQSDSVCSDLETFSFAGRLKVVVDQLKLGVGCREVMLPLWLSLIPAENLETLTVASIKAPTGDAAVRRHE